MLVEILALCDGLHFRAHNKFLQRYAVQVLEQLGAQFLPQLVGETAFTILTILQPAATCHIDFLVDWFDGSAPWDEDCEKVTGA